MDKNLIKQLNNLKNITADSEWKSRNREILITQISYSGPETKNLKNRIYEWRETIFSFSKNNLAKNISHSFVSLLLVLVVVLGGGIMSLKAAQNTKPGDSLYIAKIISEKARASLTFDEKEKARLSVEFASNRAKEIKQVLREDDNNKEKKVEDLTKSLKKEIKAARERVEKIIAQKTDDKDISNTSSQKNDNINKEVSGDSQNQEDDDKFVFSANLSKDEKGIQISEKEPNIKKDQSTTEDTSSSTLSSTNILSTTEEKNIDVNPEEILDEVSKLLEEENYDEILDKLEVVDKIIDGQYNTNDDNNIEGEVKGEFESASTTQTEIEKEEDDNVVEEESNKQ